MRDALQAITMIVSMLHTVFDVLAFKNDIGFWRQNKVRLATLTSPAAARAKKGVLFARGGLGASRAACLVAAHCSCASRARSPWRGSARAAW